MTDFEIKGDDPNFEVGPGEGAYLDDNPKTRFGAAKPGLADVPPVALLHCGLGMRNGRIKYGRMNYREKTVSASIYYEAAMRHLMAWWDGEEVASDSGVHHLGHAMACCAILLDMIELKRADPAFSWNDDRPFRGSTTHMIENWTWPLDPKTGNPVAPGEASAEYDPKAPLEVDEEFLRTAFDDDLTGTVGPDIVGLVGVCPGITSEELRDKSNQYIVDDPNARTGQVRNFVHHIGGEKAVELDQSGRTRLAFYIDARRNGFSWSEHFMDDLLAGVIGGEQ